MHIVALKNKAIALVMGIMALSCSPGNPPSLVINQLTLAESDTNCGDGHHPLVQPMWPSHLGMTHPERSPFEQRVDIEPGSRSVQVASVPVGADWDLRLTGFQSDADFEAGTYSWLARRSGVDISANQGTGAGVAARVGESLQCTRSPMAQGAMLSVSTLA